MKEIVLDHDLYEYIVTRFAVSERDLLQRMVRRARQAGLPEIQISEEQAKLVRILAQVAKARDALDVGTLFGYSAAVLARAMGPKGKVVTLELEARNAEVAQDNLEDLGLGKQVMVRVGPALEAMRSLPAQGFDLVLIDADKENYSNYLVEAIRLLRTGGLVLVDNAFAFGQLLRTSSDPSVVAVQRFNEELAARPDLESILVPVGDGLAVGRKT